MSENLDLERLKKPPFELPLRTNGEHIVDDNGERLADCIGFPVEERLYLIAAVNAAPALVEEVERLREAMMTADAWIERIATGKLHLSGECVLIAQNARAALRASEPKEPK